MTTTEKKRTAYLWGPISSFTGPLAVWLIKKGWDIHVACKSSLNLLSLSPLDLRSTAESNLDQSFESHDQAKAFQDRFKIVSPTEISKDTEYDAVIFAGLPPNFDDPRAPRAPWSIGELKGILSIAKDAPLFVVSALYGGVQEDGVVPEELEFKRRKPQTNWEGVCQQYESKLLEELSSVTAPWHLVRLPFILGSTEDGSCLNLNGLYHLARELDERVTQLARQGDAVEVAVEHNPNSTLWFLPVDSAVYSFWRYLEDPTRPRILNLIPTNSTLNQEWIDSLAKALGASGIRQGDKDELKLPTPLRKLLKDDIQVKNRNLFEVAGRYHIPPVPINQEYFAKITSSARERNWGDTSRNGSDKAKIGYSDRIAEYYFEEFLPELLNQGGLIDKIVDTGKTIAFVLKDNPSLGWVLKSPDGTHVLERYEPSKETPRISFKFSGQTLLRLIMKKLPLHRALLLREVEMQGPILPALKVANQLDKFLAEHPVEKERLSSLSAK